ncbi:hypothetical protein KUW00_06585 [Halomonas sp. DP5N14-9]|uniref:hypothetical protein n=1 Tax=Halomonas sp. DP5N14-9 TaxID=2859075 RepID=UPI001C999220|nr:hypothetical protein [Halomonas sp. DP5N14-9]MBY5940549.1 hypothetical protein [Halomonas sp. DP5N14-9]
MNKVHYHFLLILMLAGLCAGLLYHLRSEELIAPGVLAGALGTVAFVMLLALLGSRGTWCLPRDSGVSGRVQEERQEQARCYLEKHHAQEASPEVIKAAWELAQREGHLDSYEQRLADIDHQPLRLGDVWLALEGSRVEAGVKTAMDDNALTRLAQGRLDA